MSFGQASSQAAADDVDVDLGYLFASIRRKWPRMVAIALAVMGVAFLAASLVSPKYRAETRLLIEPRESVFTRPSGVDAEALATFDQEGVASQVELITSTDILLTVADELDLAHHSAFGGSGEPSLLDQFLPWSNEEDGSDDVNADDRLIEQMREQLSVYNIEKSRVIGIGFSSGDPKLAAQVANAIASAYAAEQSGAKLQSNTNATDWLEPEIEDLRQRVKEAEARVAEYRAESDLLLGLGNTALATQQLAELSSELSRMRAYRSAAEAKAQAMRAALESGIGVETQPEVLASPLVQNLQQQQAQLSTQIAELSATLLGNHPRIRALRSQLADVERQIRAEARNLLASLESEANTARRRETELTAELNRLKVEVGRVEEGQVELRALEREAAAQRDLLASYLTRYRQAAARADRNYLPADVRIFSRAVAPSEPYFPKVMPITIASFVAALLAMAVITLLQELFSGRAMRPAPAAAPIASLAAIKNGQEAVEPMA